MPSFDDALSADARDLARALAAAQAKALREFGLLAVPRAYQAVCTKLTAASPQVVSVAAALHPRCSHLGVDDLLASAEDVLARQSA